MASHLPKNCTGLLPVEDALCNWVDTIQDIKDDDKDDDEDDQIGAPSLRQQRHRGPFLISSFSRMQTVV